VSAALHPLSRDGPATSAAAYVRRLRLRERAPADRPRVVAAMVASADGRATLRGRSVGLGNPADRALFRELRTGVDAMLVGTQTLRLERYATVLDEPQRARRAGGGLPPEPLVCTVSRGLDVPVEIPLFAERGARIRIYTSADGSVGGRGAEVVVRRLPPGRLKLRAVLEDLERRDGVRAVLCEGGPTLLRSMIYERCVDDLILTLSPLLVAGEQRTVLNGRLLEPPVPLVVRDVHRSHDHLFVHYEVGG
jgi:riboflavin biosynthesis pyrimidine reductase